MNPMSSIRRLLSVASVAPRVGCAASRPATLGERAVEALVVERVLHREHPLAVQHAATRTAA